MLLETAKRLVERATGWRRPGQDELAGFIKQRKPAVFYFEDDGQTPNNAILPLLRYRRAVTFDGRRDPAAVLEAIFRRKIAADPGATVCTIFSISTATRMKCSALPGAG